MIKQSEVMKKKFHRPSYSRYKDALKHSNNNLAATVNTTTLSYFSEDKVAIINSRDRLIVLYYCNALNVATTTISVNKSRGSRPKSGALNVTEALPRD